MPLLEMLLCAVEDELDDLNSLECTACGEEFTIEEAIQKAQANLEGWQRLQAWVAAAPVK